MKPVRIQDSKSVSQMGGQVITLENSEGNITVGVFAGGNVIPLATKNNVLQFLAADPAGLLELYLFDLNTKTMTLSQQSRMSPIIKTGTYVAKCK